MIKIYKIICIAGVLNLTLHGVINKAFCQTPQTKSTQKADDRIFLVVEQQPEFPGGDKALKKFITENLVLPKIVVEE